ncbi:hypothetical protein FRB90_005102 [Tulasnella sp. 427]|nr:hypothetical protein FRB90_005102 [Tulasnella sp. 427]
MIPPPIYPGSASPLVHAPAVPPIYMPQPVIHAPSSSPGPNPHERASTPQSPFLVHPNASQAGLRTSPRSNKGVAGPRAPQTVTQMVGTKKPSKAPPAQTKTRASDTKTKPKTEADVKEEDPANHVWDDGATTLIFNYLFGDVMDGDIGEGQWRDWQKHKAHHYKKASVKCCLILLEVTLIFFYRVKKMAEQLFGGKRAVGSVKSKVERVIKIYKHIVAFEDHTGGGGDGDDDGLTEAEKIKNKLDSAQAAGKAVGKITVAEIQKWRENGCLGGSQNVRRKTALSSVKSPSPFGASRRASTSDNEEEDVNAEDQEPIVVDEGDNVETDGVLERMEDDGNTGNVVNSQIDLGASLKNTEVKREGKKRAGPSGTTGVEEPPFKKSRAAAASVDTGAFLSANTEYFQSRVEIDKKNLELREKQFKTSAALEKKKVKLELAQKILADGTIDDEEVKDRARKVLMNALEDD